MKRGTELSADSSNEGTVGFKMKPGGRRLDAGSAARFFYCAKANKKDRQDGCEDLDDKAFGQSNAAKAAIARGDSYGKSGMGINSVKIVKNNHPTVKPTDLMRYLIRLVTPPNGVVLDPFMGSGSTGKAAVLENFRFIGIDLSQEYVDIASARIGQALSQGVRKSAVLSNT
jgi:DNA modification methylase